MIVKIIYCFILQSQDLHENTRGDGYNVEWEELGWCQMQLSRLKLNRNLNFFLVAFKKVSWSMIHFIFIYSVVQFISILFFETETVILNDSGLTIEKDHIIQMPLRKQYTKPYTTFSPCWSNKFQSPCWSNKFQSPCGSDKFQSPCRSNKLKTT